MLAETTNVYIITDKGGLLLLLRSPFDESMPLFWESPGGHLDSVCFLSDYDAIKTEALRELFEETGLHLRHKDLRYYTDGSSDSHVAWTAILPEDELKDINLSSEHSASKIVYSRADIPSKVRPQVLEFVKKTVKF